MKSLQYYMVATGTWFTAAGIHQVLFAWLLTIHLLESAERVGYAQMAMVLPATLFVLVAGAIADQQGGRRIAILFQSLAVCAPLLLIVLLIRDQLSYTALILYALTIGVAQAFVIPARDGLINVVAPGGVQRAVVMSSLIQFGLQMVGFTLAAFADRTGPLPLLTCQAVLLVFGIFALAQIKEPTHSSAKIRDSSESSTQQKRRLSLSKLARGLWDSLLEGARITFGSPTMRSVILLNCGMGIFFMGSYIVTLPLLIRDIYNGSSADLAQLNTLNSFGLVVTILILIRIGDVARQGRALVFAQLIGSGFLAASGLQPPFFVVLALMFGWGACGGIAISMARALMQMLAPINMRARVMSFYVFSFTGAGTFGALLSGFLAEHFGPSKALIISAAAMFTVVALVALLTNLMKVEATSAAKQLT